MNDDQPGSEKQPIEVPAVFWSSDTATLFNTCMICNINLLETNVPYMIEKAVRNTTNYNSHEVIFEYAMCEPCALKFNSALSEESKQKIKDYFFHHIDIEKLSLSTLDERLSRCVVHNSRIEESANYQLVAQCRGRYLTVSQMPFALSSEAIEEMSDLLSVASRDEMDDFIGTYFTGPPEVAELLKKRLIFV